MSAREQFMVDLAVWLILIALVTAVVFVVVDVCREIRQADRDARSAREHERMRKALR